MILSLSLGGDSPPQVILSDHLQTQPQVFFCRMLLGDSHPHVILSDHLETQPQAVLLSSKINDTFVEYFYPETFLQGNENVQFSGWPDQYFC